MHLEESIDRILRNSALFGAVFYRRFFEAVPEASQYFEGVDMHRQAYVLTMALTLIRQHREHRYVVTNDYLGYLGSKHFDREIPAGLYSKWREVMLGTLEGFHGDDWSAQAKCEWEQAIDECIDAMMEGYATHKSV
jgi:hemoglobin-like flavoprotein